MAETRLQSDLKIAGQRNVYEGRLDEDRAIAPPGQEGATGWWFKIKRKCS